MHLITGLLLTGLFGRRRKSERSPLLSLSGPVETVHCLAGRVRFRVRRLVGDATTASKLAGDLKRIEGVRDVAADSVTGSLLFRYDPRKISAELLFTAIVRLLGLEKELDRAPQPRLAREIRSLGASANRMVYEETGGVIDLWTASLLVLAGVGILKLKNEGLGLPGGFILVWWAVMGLSRAPEGNA